jgi:hypothetical protein
MSEFTDEEIAEGTRTAKAINEEMRRLEDAHNGKPLEATTAIANCVFWTVLMNMYFPSMQPFVDYMVKKGAMKPVNTYAH